MIVDNTAKSKYYVLLASDTIASNHHSIQSQHRWHKVYIMHTCPSAATAAAAAAAFPPPSSPDKGRLKRRNYTLPSGTKAAWKVYSLVNGTESVFDFLIVSKILVVMMHITSHDSSLTATFFPTGNLANDQTVGVEWKGGIERQSGGGRAFSLLLLYRWTLLFQSTTSSADVVPTFVKH